MADRLAMYDMVWKQLGINERPLQ